MGAKGCNVHHHAHFPTFTICSSLVSLPTDVQHCTGVTYDSSQGNAPDILWTDCMAQYTCQVCRQAFGLETSQIYFLKYLYWTPLTLSSISSIAHHKHQTSVTFSCIHKVQLFKVRTQKTKDSHRKKLQYNYSRGNGCMKHSPWESWQFLNWSRNSVPFMEPECCQQVNFSVLGITLCISTSSGRCQSVEQSMVYVPIFMLTDNCSTALWGHLFSISPKFKKKYSFLLHKSPIK